MCGLGTKLEFNPEVTLTANATVPDLLAGFLSNSRRSCRHEGGAAWGGGGWGMSRAGRYGFDNLVE